MIGKHYEQALEKNPEIFTRKFRRAVWRAARKDARTHAAEAPGQGTHRQRAALWRQMWPKMSEVARQMAWQRKHELLEAARLDRSGAK